MVANTPVVNAGVKYLNGLQLAKAGNQTLSVQPGEARDSQDVNDMQLSEALSVNGAGVGANGVDVAALTLNSWYAVYLIGDSTKYRPVAALLSLDASAPKLPGDYDMYRRIGWVRTDGANNILQFWQYGNSQNRTYWWDAPVQALVAGSSVAYADVSLVDSVPPIASQVYLDVLFTPAVATDRVHFSPFGSASVGDGNVVMGAGVAAAQRVPVFAPAGLNVAVPTIRYKVDNAGDAVNLNVSGYQDYL